MRQRAAARRVTALFVLAAAAGLVPSQAAVAATAASSRSADATACSPALKSVNLAPPSLPGGASTAATVRLTCPAPAAVTVRLTGFKGATVPPTVRVARHADTARATIRTAVSSAERRGDIVAALGRVRRSARLTITRTPRTCRAPSLAGVAAPGLVYVGNQVAVTLRLSCAAATPVRVSLASSSSYLPVPRDVTVGRYYATTAVLISPKADEAGQYLATITARLGTRSLARNVTVDPGLSTFQIPPCSEPNCVAPDVLFTGVIPAGGFTVKLASDNPAVTVPSSYTFQAGSLGGDFPGVTVKTVSKNTKVTLSATFGGRTLTASTVLLPPWTTSDSLTLSAENGPGPIYGQEYDLEYIVLLSNPAPASGETVTFSATDPSIELQSTSTYIAPGDDDGYVDINTADITAPVHATLKATVDGVAASLAVTIEPGLASITNVPATVVGGQGFTATVNLAGDVDTPTTVALQSTDGVLTVPVTVTIAAGQSSANFPVTTVSVATDVSVTIYAYLGTSNINSSAVTVTPTG